ncbi:MAG: hypothetical protein P8X91_07465 [Candidatus Bathyarchaeota archaeon]|jgi:hypothetical protein
MKRKKQIISSMLILIIFSFSLIGSVMASSEIWEQTYGENDNFYAESFVQSSNGGFVIAGTSESGALLLKTDSIGNIEWKRTYSEINVRTDMSDGDIESLIETSDGGYALVISQRLLVKFDMNGIMEWNRTLLGGHRPRSLIQTSDGGFVVAGSSGDRQLGEENYFWLTKTDELGYNLWNKTYKTIITGSAGSVIQTFDGGFALLGSNTMNSDFLLVKTDSSGELEWLKKYEKPDIDTGQRIVQNNDGGYTMAGMIWNRSDLNNMAGLIKTDSNGTMLWMKNYYGSWHVSMEATSDGGYILLSDSTLSKTDSEGNIQWTKGYHGNAHSVIQTHEGYAILGTGSFLISDDPPIGKYYVWIIKTDSIGSIPEFSSLTILPIILVSSLAVILCRNKIQKNRSK